MRVHELISHDRVNHIVEADIKGFFDNVPHEELMDMLRVRIKDSSMLGLIQKFLDAGHIDDGLLTASESAKRAFLLGLFVYDDVIRPALCAG